MVCDKISKVKHIGFALDHFRVIFVWKDMQVRQFQTSPTPTEKLYKMPKFKIVPKGIFKKKKTQLRFKNDVKKL